MERRTIFPHRVLPALLVLPQLALTVVFFLWPAAQGMWSSLYREDPFGLSAQFVGLANFVDLFSDPLYRASLVRTVFFCAAVSALALASAFVLAVFADREIRGRNIYRTLLIWPYAVAPAMSAVLWILMLHPQIGLIGRWLNANGVNWNYRLNGYQAMGVVIFSSAWKQVSYNFIFLVAGLQSIPRAVMEAARMDGAKGLHRVRTIILPMLMPTVFFLLIADLVYSAFDTFATIMALTQGGPAQSTVTLVVQVYRDGFINQNIGGSSAESVVLMAGVIALSVLQFRFLGRRTT